MKTIEQFAAVIPYGESLLHTAEGVYGFSRETTVGAYKMTMDKIITTRKKYLQFRENLNKVVVDIAFETADQVMKRFENIVGIERSEIDPQTVRSARMRFQVIFQTILTEYILKNRLLNSQKGQTLMRYGNKYSTEYLIPLYISLRASLIVTKQMFIQFMQKRFNNFKLSYESSKDNVVMFIAGSFDEKKIKEKIIQGLSTFKRFTITVASKGIEIAVDRQSLVQNYDRFTTNFLEIVQEISKKGQVNMTQIKKKSRDLYREVINRIRAKQLELKTQLRGSQSLKIEQ